MNNPLQIPNEQVILQACQNFKKAWLAQENPRIEDFLKGASTTARGGLVRQLVELEVNLRRREGEAPHVDEYRQRFPQEAQWLQVLLDQGDEASPHLQATLAADEGPRGEGQLNNASPGELASQQGVTPQQAPRQKQSPAEGAGEGSVTIPGYQIVSEIHRGGQGVVYRAIQVSTRRTVAVKVLLHGQAATETERRRFDREVDLLASVKHPYIVTVYDSGLTDQGLQYLAMEYVAGKTLDQYLSSGGCESTEEVLGLFLKICQGMNHAHLRGIIHRDLKPGNILIDEEGQPRILDFGLARPILEPQQSRAEVTATGQFVGTLAFASPEQLSADPNAIDIRTDIYSLGVILYTMLTGRFPYPVMGQMGELIQAIASRQPAPPSAASGEQVGGRLSFPVKRALDAIVLKALQKDPDHRYQAVNALGEDLQRYVAGEPLLHAQPPSLASMLWLWLTRNVSSVFWTISVGFLCGILVNLAVGVSVIASLQRQAYQAMQDNFPSLPPPKFLIDYTLLPDEAWLPVVGLGIIAYLFMGFLTVALIRSRNKWTDILAGFGTGSTFAIATYTMTVGWWLFWVINIAPTLGEWYQATSWRALPAAHRQVLGPQEHLVAVDIEPFLQDYPDLQAAPVRQQGAAVVLKWLYESIVAAERAIWSGVLLCLLTGVGTAVFQTILSGYLCRWLQSWWKIILLYLTVVIPFLAIMLILLSSQMALSLLT